MLDDACADVTTVRLLVFKGQSSNDPVNIDVYSLVEITKRYGQNSSSKRFQDVMLLFMMSV